MLQQLIISVFECLHVTGFAILAFKILPQLDAMKGVMLTNCLCIIPGILGLFSRSPATEKFFLKILADILAIAIQITGIFLWPLTMGNVKLIVWTFISCIFISVGWWENYVSIKSFIRKKNFIYNIYYCP